MISWSVKLVTFENITTLLNVSVELIIVTVRFCEFLQFRLAATYSSDRQDCLSSLKQIEESSPFMSSILIDKVDP